MDSDFFMDKNAPAKPSEETGRILDEFAASFKPLEWAECYFIILLVVLKMTYVFVSIITFKKNVSLAVSTRQRWNWSTSLTLPLGPCGTLLLTNYSRRIFQTTCCPKSCLLKQQCNHSGFSVSTTAWVVLDNSIKFLLFTYVPYNLPTSRLFESIKILLKISFILPELFFTTKYTKKQYITPWTSSTWYL